MRRTIALVTMLMLSTQALSENESEVLDVADIRAKYEAQYNAWLDAYEHEYEENLAEQRKQNEEFAEQLEESKGLLERQEKLLGSSEENERHFAKILERWEQQQAQYQKYLDSLPLGKK
jgi:hypothetical protein